MKKTNTTALKKKIDMKSLRVSKSDWVRGSCIGRGCYGTVNKAVDKSDGRIFAVKSVDLRSCLAAQAKALENEIKILQSISSSWVVDYLGDDITTENGEITFRNLHMEYMPGGTAADVVKDEEIIRSRVYCLVSGLSDVHKADIVHGDIKGRNILIGSSASTAKLADFGSASFVAHGETCGVVPRGSPLWMAPEVVRGEYQGPESDIWSLGCTVIEMVTGRPPWEHSGPETLLRIGYSKELPQLPAQLSELGKDFLAKCLRRDQAERWNCAQLLCHPFLSLSEPLNLITHASPRCVLDWTTLEFSDYEEEDEQMRLDPELVKESGRERIWKLATNVGTIWESGGWVEVRGEQSDKKEQDEGTISEYSNSSRTVTEIQHLEFGDNSEVETDISWTTATGYKSFTADENILFVNLLILTAITCTFNWFTLIKSLRLYFI